MITVALGLHNRENYFLHSLTCVHSLLSNTREQVRVCLLHDSTVTKEHQACFRALTRHHGAHMAFFDLEQGAARALEHIRGTFSVAALYRLFLPDILPDSTVLYLDSDICCTLDVGGLFALAAAEPAVSLWAVQDEAVCLPRFGAHVRELGLAPELYFNSGVLLLHCPRIVRLFPDFSAQCIKMLHGGALPFPDQDVLNGFFLRQAGGAEVRYADSKYNYNLSIKNRHMRPPEKLGGRIVHYGYHKPWEKAFPAALVYWQYRESLFSLLSLSERQNPLT